MNGESINPELYGRQNYSHLDHHENKINEAIKYITAFIKAFSFNGSKVTK